MGLTDEEREALLSCDCGHGLWEHNGLGCYGVVTYTPTRVTCSCRETDDRPSVNFAAVERIVAARVGEVVERVEAVAAIPEQCHCGLPQVETGRAVRAALRAADAPLSDNEATTSSTPRWVDKQGDVWTLGDDGLMHTPETTPLPREHVERKWGPLRLADDAPGGKRVTIIPLGRPPTPPNRNPR